MAKSNEGYRFMIVESFIPDDRSGKHGLVHVRPVAAEGFDPDIMVECSKKLVSSVYPPGTTFRIKAKLTDREGGGEFLYSYFGWPFEVISIPKKAQSRPAASKP